MINRAILVPVLAVATLVARPAMAEPAGISDNDMIRIVHYGDLDLRAAAGQARLTRRIIAAAGILCPGDDRASPAPPLPEAACVREVTREPLEQMKRAIAQAEGGAKMASADRSLVVGDAR
ncbi:MAG: UrcA family protein [Tepidisphaeraceae bacterium]